MTRQLAVIPQSMIAERHHLCLDGPDEMWEGVLHMNEPGSWEHHALEARLVAALQRVARDGGLQVATEAGVFDPEVPDYRDFRTPDLVLAEPTVTADRGVEGRAALVVEIRSPGDESFEKIPFYGRVGVQELLIIDRDTKDVRRWLHDGAGALVEAAPGGDGWHRLAAVPAEIRGAGGVLHVRIDGEESTV